MLDAYQNLLEQCSDSDRHPLIDESADWDKTITPGLVEFGTVMTSIGLDAHAHELFLTLRVLFETVYVLGYRRGKFEQTMPSFEVIPDETEHANVVRMDTED